MIDATTFDKTFTAISKHYDHEISLAIAHAKVAHS